MRLFEFITKLNEDRASTIAQKQGIQLVNKSKQNGENIESADEILTILKQADPARNKQNLQWLTTQYLHGQFKLADANEVNQYLKKFEHIKSRLDNKDINKYSYSALKDSVDKEYNVELQDKNDDSGFFKDCNVLYNGPLGWLASPTTKEASQRIGSGTKWCTAAQNDNKFKEYDAYEPIYIWRDKNGEKYQLNFSHFQFKDSSDEDIPDELLTEYRTTHPVLSKLFKKYESRFLKDPYDAYRYAALVLKKRWPEAEAVIATNPQYARWYNEEFGTNI
jgi:hypothetical protein